MKSVISRVLFGLLLPGLAAVTLAGCGPSAPAAPVQPAPAPAAQAPVPPAQVLPAPTVTKTAASFQVAALTIAPAELIAGKTATASAEIKNSGETGGTYSAKLSVDGKVVATKDVAVAAGATQKVSFSWTPDAGSHTLELGGTSKTIKALKPAEVNVRSLKVTPGTVFPGQQATVEAEVSNTGEVGGAIPVALKVNGIEADTQMVTLQPGAAGKVSFKVSRDVAGRYDLAVGQLPSSLFTVVGAEAYKSDQFLFSMSYPADWTLNKDNPAQVKMSKSGLAAIVVGSNRLSVAMSQEEFYKVVGASVASRLTGYKLIAESEVKKDGASYAYRRELTYTAGTSTVRRAELFLKRGRYAFQVVGEALDPVWSLNKDLIEASLDSFKPPGVSVGSYANTLQGFSFALPSGWDALETDQARRPVVAQSDLVTVGDRQYSPGPGIDEPPDAGG